MNELAEHTTLKRSFQALTLVGALGLAVSWWQHSGNLAYGASIILIAGFVLGLCVSSWATYRFTLWILIANLTALLAPGWFLSIGSFSLTNSWLMLIVVQLIMFGMGTQMSVRDLAQVALMPKGVIVGLACQFTIMPLLGFSLAHAFQLPPEIAAGVILIGSCSSGLASNVMTFIAKGNLALSVAITALATAMAPVMTPMWMKILAGSLVEVDAFKMSLEIIKMVIVPIMAAFVHDWLANYGPRIRQQVLVGVAVSAVWLLIIALGGWQWLIQGLPEESRWIHIYSIPGFLAAALAFGAVYHFAVQAWPKLDRWMPVVSMFGIVYFTLVTTAKGRDQLMDVGALLLLATFLHNMLGYVLGYWGGRLFGMSKQDSRTIAIEVGTQNGAMATGLARAMGKLETVGLSAIIFAPLMNITGSIIANYWRRSSDEIASAPTQDALTAQSTLVPNQTPPHA